MVVQSDNVGIAFALVTAAGLSTALGASVVFFPRLVSIASRKTLAGGLGLSAGVMMYVSFVEIFGKAVQSFEVTQFDDANAYLYGSLCFFAGVVIMSILGFFVNQLLKVHGTGHKHAPPPSRHQESAVSDDGGGGDADDGQGNETKKAVDRFSPPCCQDDPGAALDDIQKMANDVENEDTFDIPEDIDIEGDSDSEDDESVAANEDDKRKLVEMSATTAAAIALHNFPEGLATFVAALHDPAVGAVLAVAIAVHNIPEGLCVAMPVYYGTGSRWKAFTWALFSGVSEPIAAIFGYLILANAVSETVYGVLFGMVSGMMVIISVKELLPTAHRYDPQDEVVTNTFIVGMGIMALSLVLFQFN